MLRQAVASDISGIQRVRRSVRENRLLSTVIADAQVRDAIENTGRGWVVESDGEVVAFAVGNATNGNIWALFVHPDHERRGHGRLLHDTMVEWLRGQGLERLWLTTEPGTRAQRFYEKAGWELQGRTESGELRYERSTRVVPSRHGESSMSDNARFTAAFPYQKDVLALPVTDLDAASRWYSTHFGMKEVERRASPTPTVVLERDGVRLGFAVNGGDAAQDGAAIRVARIDDLMKELEKNGVDVGNARVDERNGKKLKVFFAVAPDGLCYYFHEPLDHP